jgi:hypothetical protein
MRPEKASCLIAAAMLLLALTGCMMPAQQNAQQAQAPATQEQAQAPQAAAAPAPAASPASAPQPAVDRQTYNQQMLDEQLKFTAFPLVREVTLEEGMKYSVYFETDSPIRFVVYNEARYNDWKQSGQHTMSKATTNSADGCCGTDGNFAIDINRGEVGKYYLVFDASDLKLADPRPSQGIVRVTKTSNI